MQRLSMRKIREALRLRADGLSGRQVARACLWAARRCRSFSAAPTWPGWSGRCPMICQILIWSGACFHINLAHLRGPSLNQIGPMCMRNCGARG